MKRPRQRRQRRRGPPRSSRALDLSNFNGRRKWHWVIERPINAASDADGQVVAIQLGRLAQGLQINPLVNRLFGAATTNPAWSLNNLRYLRFSVQFDNRGTGVDVSKQLAVSARPRVGAFLTAQPLAELDEAKILSNLALFAGGAHSPNVSRSINLRVGPEWGIGRFGPDTGTQLVIVASGFNGIARVHCYAESTGYPETTLETVRQEEEFEHLQLPSTSEGSSSQPEKVVAYLDGPV